MMTTSILLDPTAERLPDKRQRLRPLKDLRATTIGLLDISKARGDIFLDEIARLLTERGQKVRRYQKPTFARVAPIELQQEISSHCGVVIEALAD